MLDLGSQAEAAYLDRLCQTLSRQRERLLSTPGCSGVAIARKRVRGREEGQPLSITVFVDRKTPRPSPEHAVPSLLEGMPTDVAERRFAFRDSATDPHRRHHQLHGGLAITAYEDPGTNGSIGCFIRTSGRRHLQLNINIAAGVYLLTNHHVVQAANPATGADPRILQPEYAGHGAPPDNLVIGRYVHGFRGATDDCAIVSVDPVRRRYANKVPSKPMTPGYNTLAGIAQPAVGQRVYKFGATTRYTKAQITAVNYSTPDGRVRGAIYIENRNHHLWAAGGDSGSVAILLDTNEVVGLNFMEDTQCPVQGGHGCYAGLAYPIGSQMNNFCNPNGQVSLA